jgi:hypothetical protein
MLQKLSFGSQEALKVFKARNRCQSEVNQPEEHSRMFYLLTQLFAEFLEFVGGAKIKVEKKLEKVLSRMRKKLKNENCLNGF